MTGGARADCTTFYVQYRGPAVDAGRMTYAELERAAGSAIRATLAAADLMFGAAVKCEAAAAFAPRYGRISVSFTCTADGERCPERERALAVALTGALAAHAEEVVAERRRTQRIATALQWAGFLAVAASFPLNGAGDLPGAFVGLGLGTQVAACGWLVRHYSSMGRTTHG